MITTPNQLSQRAEFYHQLGSLLSAGVPIIQALEQLRHNPPMWEMREPLRRILAELQAGQDLTTALERSGKWLPEFDLALLEAGEKSGRLEQCFRLLAGYYRERAQLLRRIISNLAYPVLVFHMLVLIFPISGLTELVWKGNVRGFLLQKSFLLLIYAVVFIITYLSQGQRGETVRSNIEALARGIPFFGAARRDLALARLAAALEALINAGVPIIAAWEVAGTASGSPELRRAISSWRPQLEGGRTPSELIKRSRVFPELFANLYHSGETSGQQDETLRRLYAYYQEEGSRKMELFAQWFPRVIYFAVAGAVAFYVVRFWMNYFAQISNAIGF